MVSRKIESIPKKLGRGLTVFFTLFMVLDMAVSAGAVYRQNERLSGVPAENPVQSFFDETFPDEVLQVIYPHMQFVGRPEAPQKLLSGEAEPLLYIGRSGHLRKIF